MTRANIIFAASFADLYQKDAVRYSNIIESITVKRRGDVRQAKLYYLRERSGKSARIKEKI